MLPALLAHADEVIAIFFAALHESAFGTKRTSLWSRSMSAFGGKADISGATKNFS
jgi:hypothetical protein